MICYEGPLKDYSGYGEANRHAVAALDAAGVDVCCKLLKYTSEPSDFGQIGVLVDNLLKKQGEYRIKIMHTTPDEFKRLLEPKVFHIAHFFWETSEIPKVYADGLNMVDEIWTGSQANYDAIRASGVETNIRIFPQAIETNRLDVEPYVIDGFDGFLFYSMFEWTDRKNPEALLRAFYQEFDSDENVGLLLKTYFRNFTYANKKMIRNKCQMIKSEYGDSKPPVFLYLDLLDRQQIQRIHKTADCYVSPHRGEGWGLPVVEAMLSGNMPIVTGYGGVGEYLNDSVADVLNFKLEPLRGMSHASYLYTNTQKWAEVEINDIRKSLRNAFDNIKETKVKGIAAKEFVNTNFNLSTVGKLMSDRLMEIEAQL